MEIVLGGVNGQVERPQTLKFAWPIVVLPELFTTPRHTNLLVGYLVSIGWEVYALNLHERAGASERGRRQGGFAAMVAAVERALAAIDRDAIIAGHGLGGLLALKLTEHPRVKAAVGIAPLISGLPSPLFAGMRNRLARWLGGPLKPPTGKMLFEFIADADAFQRDTIIRTLVPGESAIASEIMRGAIDFASARAAPRLIIAGDADVFAPADQMAHFADAIGSRLVIIKGRGHWLVGGRALERVVGEMQRFLVRTLGEELLLLYPDELKDSDGDR